MAALTRMAFSNACRVMICDGRRSSWPSLRSAAPASWAAGRGASRRPASRRSGSCIPSASARHAMVEAVPIVMQWPQELAMPLSAAKSRPASCGPRRAPARSARRRCPSRGPPAELAVQHRPAGDHDRREVDARRPHQQPRRGLVAAAQQNDAVDRVGPRISSTSMATGCGTAWPWAASGSRPATWPGTPAAIRPLPRHRASLLRRCRAGGRCRRQLRPGVAMPITGRPSKTSGGKPSECSQDR